MTPAPPSQQRARHRVSPMMLAALACAILLTACFAPVADAARRVVEVGVGRGLDVTVVPALLMDRDGLLWIGSREGLFRYDGYLATPYRPVPGDAGSISDVDVRSLYEGHDGSLWISTNTAGLNRLDRRTGRFTRYGHDSADPTSLSDPSVYGVAEDSTGRLWVGSQRGLNRLDAAGRHFTRYFHEKERKGSLANDWVFAVHCGHSGALWIGTVGGGVDRWTEQSGQFENFRLSALAGGSPLLDDVFALYEAADGRLWIGTRGGLVVLDPAHRTALRVDLANDAGEQPLVTSMHADGAARLWVTTMQHGVIEVNLASRVATAVQFDFGDQSAKVQPRPLLSIAIGPHHLFIGTWGTGVQRAPLEAPPFKLLTSGGPAGLNDRNVTAVLGSAEAGQPWAGSFGGGPQRADVEAGTAARPPGRTDDPIAVSGVVSLARGPAGEIYAGTTQGLFRFLDDGSTVSLEQHEPGRRDSIGPGYVAALLPAEHGALWVGTGGSGLHLRNAGGSYAAFRHDPAVRESLSGDYVTALAPGGPAHLWVGTRSDGLNLCRIEPWSCHRAPTEGPGQLATHHVTSLRPAPDGSLWVATDGGGLQRVVVTGGGEPRVAARWGAAQGLIDDGIMAIEQDSDGTLWLSTRRGLARLDPASGRVVNHVAESGLPAMHFNTGASSADARHLYFGSVDGLVSIPKGTALQARVPTPVAITAVERLGTQSTDMVVKAALDDGFESQHGDGLAIEFAVLDFAETAHDYAYRMDPDAPWTSLGHRRQVTFLGLKPGHYGFEVRGRDVFGQWSTSRPLRFEVVPPLWMRPWFRTLAIAALALLALGMHLARMRTLKTRNAVLEDLEQQRELALERARASQRELSEAYAGLRQLTGRLESAKEDERTRISRELHDEFGQTLTAAKITLQMLRTDAGNAVVAEGLTQSVSMVDRMIRQARDIARGLRPPLLDEAGLVPALEHHLQSLSGLSGVRIELHAGPGATAAPAGLDTTVFRIVQEAVSNALRHAHAQLVSVTLDARPDSLRVVVADDGVGFDPDTVRQRIKRGEHLGLLGMTERVRSAGGTIELESRPGGGSRIEVQLPYGKPDPASRTGEESVP